MKLRLICVLLVAGLTVGCIARYYDHSKFPLDVGESTTFEIDGVSRKRVLRVMGTATGGKVDVYVYLDDNREEIEQLLLIGKGGRLMLEGVEDADKINLIATIPPEKAVVVMVRNRSDQLAEVDLKMAD